MTLLGEAHIIQSIQLNAMKPYKFIRQHQVQSTVLGTYESKVIKTRLWRSCPSQSHNWEDCYIASNSQITYSQRYLKLYKEKIF